MTEVGIGDIITYEGYNYVCMEISEVDSTLLSATNSDLWEAEHFKGNNILSPSNQILEFAEGEVIRLRREEVRFVCENKTFYYYTYLIVGRESEVKEILKHGQSRDERETGETPDRQVESLGGRDQGGESVGVPSDGQNGGTLHGDGSGGEGGDNNNPGIGKRGEHSTPIHGGDSSGGG